MSRSDAKRIAETITQQQLADMFARAKVGITDWEQVSAVNAGMTKGTAWNILYRGFNLEKVPHPLARKNMIWEFGDFLDDALKPVKKPRQAMPTPHHEDPRF
jgi:hypothetical protein